MTLSYEPVVAQDFDVMLALRMEALRESLTRLGRWNPEFSRQHFLKSFDPPHMRHIVHGGERVGFYTFMPEGENLRLRHLYLNVGTRGRGLGSVVVRQLQDQAAPQGRAIVLEALQQSDSNRFYVRHGFVKTGEDALDVFYRWQPVRLSKEPM